MFCECGTLISLPPLVSQPVICRRCKRTVTNIPNKIHISSKYYSQVNNLEVEKVTGAKIKMECPNCQAKEMAYSTVQLRSADEGQTVFYHCESCEYKITVNS